VTINPKVQVRLPREHHCSARQGVPFDADRCHQLGVSHSRINPFQARNASQRVKLPDGQQALPFDPFRVVVSLPVNRCEVNRSVLFATLRRAVLLLSLLAGLALFLAQLGAYLEFELVPAPTAVTNGPQSSADFVFGLLALGGGGLGFLLTVAAGSLGLVVAATERRAFWVAAICVSGALVLVGLVVSAFVLVGLPRNPYHPFTVLLLLPVTTLAFWLADRQREAR
jgi:hypothetical protein